MTKLLHFGKILANEQCPFKAECPYAQTDCNRETNIEVQYSCGYARLFDLMGTPKSKSL